MIDDGKLALYLMLGQTATKTVDTMPEVADKKPLMLSDTYDLTTSLPEAVKSSSLAAEGYRLFFVFERYLREFIVETLSKDGTETWWDKIPPDVQQEINKMEDNEEMKSWMALGSRDKSALMTYPQLLKIMDDCWKLHFQDIVRDKALIQEARLIAHLRNTICHMSTISLEEMERVKQVIRDWFRVVSP
jgi:hypothetical protein